MTFASWPRLARTPVGGRTCSPTPPTSPNSTTSPDRSGCTGRGFKTTTPARTTTSPIDFGVVRSRQAPNPFPGETFPLCGRPDALTTRVAAHDDHHPYSRTSSNSHALDLLVDQLGAHRLTTVDRPPPVDSHSAQRTATDRAASPDYRRWLNHVSSVRGCERPIRLAGHLHTINPSTGEILSSKPTETLPDGVIYVPCGDRRASVCPACAETYRADTYQLIRAGLVGGKGVPDTVATHPVVFATFTAPSFGPVHTRVVDLKTGKVKPCRMRRSIERCPHGRVMTCPHRHTENSPCIGQPLCPQCYDYDHHVVWNAWVPELWRRTRIAADRQLRSLERTHGVRLRLSYAKVAEYQARGLIHFHALIRLDAIDPADPETPAAPTTGDHGGGSGSGHHHRRRLDDLHHPTAPE